MRIRRLVARALLGTAATAVLGIALVGGLPGTALADEEPDYQACVSYWTNNGPRFLCVGVRTEPYSDPPPIVSIH